MLEGAKTGGHNYRQIFKIIKYYMYANTFKYLGKGDTFLKKQLTKNDAKRNIKY